jgi:hypothetical protein
MSGGREDGGTEREPGESQIHFAAKICNGTVQCFTAVSPEGEVVVEGVRGGEHDGPRRVGRGRERRQLAGR